MSISRQIGWNNKEKLLYDIYNKFRRANGLAYKWTQGDFFQQGSKLKVLSFEAPENQTVVGQINEPAATSFAVTEGAEYFTIDNLGLIEFKVAPDYEIKNEYYLKVRTDKHTYSVSVNVTDVASEFELLYETTLLTATAF